MKKTALILALAFVFLTAVSCSSGRGGNSLAASAPAADSGVPGDHSDGSGKSDGERGTADASQEIYDLRGKAPEEINRLYEEYIRQHGGKNLRRLDINSLYDVFAVQSILTGEGYYTLDGETGWIDVYDKDFVYSEQTLFEAHIKNREYLTLESIGIYRDDQTVRDEAFLNEYPVCCCIYEKEGIKVYAIRSAGLTHNYDIYFEIDGVYFGVGTVAYRYPDEIGVLPAKDEWDGQSGSEAFFELSDVTTGSSALIRALKEAVGADA